MFASMIASCARTAASSSDDCQLRSSARARSSRAEASNSTRIRSNSVRTSSAACICRRASSRSCITASLSCSRSSRSLWIRPNIIDSYLSLSPSSPRRSSSSSSSPIPVPSICCTPSPAGSEHPATFLSTSLLLPIPPSDRFSSPPIDDESSECTSAAISASARTCSQSWRRLGQERVGPGMSMKEKVTRRDQVEIGNSCTQERRQQANTCDE